MIDWAHDALRSGGGWGLLLVMVVEHVFPPIPSEVVLPFAGYLVGLGDLSAVTALVGSTVGSVLGAVMLYALGRFGGRPVVLRWHRVLRLSEADLDRADGWFDRRGWTVVLLGRVVPFARSAVSVPAGMSEMPVGRFVLLTAIGSGVWNAALIAAGVVLGEQYARLETVLSARNVALVLAAFAAVVVAGVWLSRRRG